MTPTTAQRGSALIVSLMLLLVITMLAISAVNTGTIDMRILSNTQAKTRAEMAVTRAMDDYVSDIGNFTSPASETVTVDNLPVAFTRPVCRTRDPADGYSATWGLAPEDNNWVTTASVTDANTNARATLVQGLTIRMLNGSCIP